MQNDFKNNYNFNSVMKVLDVTQGKLRYWCQTFDEFLESEYHDEFSELDLIVLKYIKYMFYEKNKSVKEIRLDLHKQIIVFRDNLSHAKNEGNEIQILQSAIQQDQEKLLKFISNDVINQLANFINNKVEIESQKIIAQNQKIIQDEIRKATGEIKEFQQYSIDEITETVSNSLNASQEQLKSAMDNISNTINSNAQKSSERDLEISNLLRENLSLKRKIYDKEANSNKGIFNKLFKMFK